MHEPIRSERKAIDPDGVLIPRDVADRLRDKIRRANEIYADETRSDWFDADDLCREVCDELEGYLN